MLNHMRKNSLSRREFLKIAAAGLGGLGLNSFSRLNQTPEFPVSDVLGRAFAKVEIKARPDYDSQIVGVLYDDAVVPWLHEVVGRNPYRNKQRWVETPDGYIWAPDLQKVRNLPNQPVPTLSETSLGTGMWVEVTVPYIDIVLENAPVSPGFKFLRERRMPLRLYYSQILWVDRLRTDDAQQVWYRVNERFGYGDLIWAPAQAFRPLTVEEVAPINPNVEDKRIEINVEERYQTLSCFEGNSEVYFCRISAGKKFDPDGTPLFVSAVGSASIGAVVLLPDGSVRYTAPASYLGPATFSYTVSDGALTATASVTVTVVSGNLPPVCSAVAAPGNIWPPNHKAVYVSLSGITDPEGGAVTVRFASILQDEPTNSAGQGNTKQDGGIERNGARAWVRAERVGTRKVPGDGRVYIIGYTATDAGGASCSGTVFVGVPHDKGKGPAVLSPSRWNSITGQHVSGPAF